MAYLRKEKELVEVDYPINQVWEAITKALTSLEWKAQETKPETHQIKAKTKANFMAYASELNIQATEASEKATRITISAETPVTTITGIVDFGRTQQRIESFLMALMKELKGETAPQDEKKPS
jgi:hypothetical protein